MKVAKRKTDTGGTDFARRVYNDIERGDYTYNASGIIEMGIDERFWTVSEIEREDYKAILKEKVKRKLTDSERRYVHRKAARTFEVEESLEYEQIVFANGVSIVGSDWELLFDHRGNVTVYVDDDGYIVSMHYGYAQPNNAPVGVKYVNCRLNKELVFEV